MPILVKPTEDNIDQIGEGDVASVQVKVPRRILHFSDGTLEEYSDDDEQTGATEPPEPVVDPKTLAWLPWTSYMVWAAGSSALAGCDYVGEWLASAFGITTPKYYFEIEESKRREVEKKRLEDESRGWAENAQDGTQLVTMDVISRNSPGSNSQPSPDAVQFCPN